MDGRPRNCLLFWIFVFWTLKANRFNYFFLPPFPEFISSALNQLSSYADENSLTVNIAKTKCLTFYKGRCRVPTFMFKNEPLENCNQFTYLGVVFTTRLSACKHVEHVVSKCNARIGSLFHKLPLKSIPLEVAKAVFHTYVKPILTYCASIWFPLVNKNGLNRINAIYTKFLKRCLGIPKSASNACLLYTSDAADD